MRNECRSGDKSWLRPVTRRRALVALSCLALLTGGGPVRAATGLSEPAQQWVGAFTNDGLALLRDRTASTEQQVARFRQLLDTYFAIDAIGRWVLGRYWRQATEQERQDYLALFEDFVVYGYVQRFSEYSGETIRIVNAADNADGSATVNSLVERRNSDQPIRVDWRVSRSDDGAMRLTDVVIENVSLSQTYRADFAATLQQQGGDISGLLAVLRQRVAAQKAQLGIRP